MSTIQANAILDASGGNTTTINGVTPNTDSVRGRNIIINGAMQVAQRGTSFTGLANSPEYTVDRFEFRRINAWSTGRFAMTQESDGPAGFAKSIKLATTTAETDTSSIASISTRLEGLDCQSLKYGTASAESVTLSFWVKSYQTGTYSFLLNVANLNQSIYGSLYTINSSNTWEYKTITIPAPALAATTAINNDTAQGLELIWHFTYRDSAGTLTNNSWDETTGSAATRWYSVNGQTINGSTSTSNYLQITGVKLEVGSLATEFDHRSFGEEISLCQRYFYTTYEYGTALGTSTLNGTTDAISQGGTNRPVWTERFYNKMRTTPSLTFYSGNTGTSGKVYSNIDGDINGGSFGVSSSSFKWYAAGTTTSGAEVYAHWTADAEL
jgi:hypothetical protein